MRRGIIALAALAVAAPLLVTGVASSRSVAYCSVIPIVQVQREAWGFHAGLPITGATGSYARGHGQVDLNNRTATGVICQVDRVRHAPDRQIVLSVDRRLVYASHHAAMFGVAGNIIKLDVLVKRSTDPRCAVGTAGQVTIFASYNNVHEDFVGFSFPAACRDHRHAYTIRDVVTNVPPN